MFATKQWRSSHRQLLAVFVLGVLLLGGLGLLGMSGAGAATSPQLAAAPPPINLSEGNGSARPGADTSREIAPPISDSPVLTRVAAITLTSGEYYLDSAVIDPAGGYAYFGTNIFPGQVVKIRLSDFTRVGAITLLPGERTHSSKPSLYPPSSQMCCKREAMPCP